MLTPKKTIYQWFLWTFYPLAYSEGIVKGTITMSRDYKRKEEGKKKKEGKMKKEEEEEERGKGFKNTTNLNVKEQLLLLYA